MTTGKALRTALTLAAVLCVAPVAKAATVNGPVIVNQGEVESYTTATTISGSGTADETLLDIHGKVVVTKLLTLDNQSNPFYIDLGSNPGDEGLWVVSNNFNTVGIGKLRIGHNGGGDNAMLSLYGGWSANQRLHSLELDANATTLSNSFQAVRIGNGALRVGEGGIINNNRKPLEISFLVQNTANALVSLETTGGVFVPRTGDIVLRSTKQPYQFSTVIKLLGTAYNGAEICFFPSDTSGLNGVVRTEGLGDVMIDLSLSAGTDHKPFTWNLNATNLVWNHGGDFIIGRASSYGTLKVTVDNALPHGPQTGDVVLKSTSGTLNRPTLDLAGTTQRINGLKMDGGGGVVTNSAATEAVLVFGTGDADGEINMDITNSAIRCEKVGAGRLTLNGGALNTLSGSAGEIFVKAATYVDTLALTNMTIVGDLSLLTVRENLSQYTLSDGAASNCVIPVR